MSRIDKPYWKKRAVEELDAFKSAKGTEASRAHYELARLYFLRAGYEMVEQESAPEDSSEAMIATPA